MKLIVQPDAGAAPVIQAIRKAKKSIDVFIFRLDITEIERALMAAVQRGVRVRAVIAHTNRGGEARLRKLEQRLLAGGVTVSRTADDLLRYHAKYVIADEMLHVFGFNFTKLDLLRSRSFAIATRDRRAVAEASRLFEADATRQEYKPARSNLVVSPETARSTLTDFLKGARRELAIYDARLDDVSMLKLLKQLAGRGVRIRVIGVIKKGCEGVDVRPLGKMRLHVRAIVRDGTRAFVGSQSLRKIELDSRREVGLLVNNPTVTRKLLQVFEQDWLDAEQKNEKAKDKDKDASDKRDDAA